MKIKMKVEKEFDVKFLKVDAGVRYWEDAKVNGVRDTDLYESNGVGKPLMPCAVQIKEKPDYNIHSDHYRWRPLIDIETGQIVNWEQGFYANVHYKVCDDFTCYILNGNNEVVYEYDDYVPSIMCPADEGYGDYIIMDIDEKGFIQKWDKEQIRKFVN